MVTRSASDARSQTLKGCQHKQPTACYYCDILIAVSPLFFSRVCLICVTNAPVAKNDDDDDDDDGDSRDDGGDDEDDDDNELFRFRSLSSGANTPRCIGESLYILDARESHTKPCRITEQISPQPPNTTEDCSHHSHTADATNQIGRKEKLKEALSETSSLFSMLFCAAGPMSCSRHLTGWQCGNRSLCIVAVQIQPPPPLQRGAITPH